MENIIILLVFIALSAFFSGSETALIYLSILKVKHLVEKKKRNSKILEKLKKDERKLLITLLIGNNFVNIAASALATALAIDAFGSKGIGIATGIMTFLILVFGEIVPKSFAIQYSEKISLWVAKPIYFLQLVLWPLVKILEIMTKTITAGKIVQKKPLVTEEELKNIVNISEEEGSIKSLEKEMIQNIFKFDDIEVREVMTPRTDMVSVNANSILIDIVDFLIGVGHSRIPAYEGEVDNIIGVLFVKDVLPYLKEKKFDVKVKDILREPHFVPETKTIDTMLREFQRKKMHMAIVVDEHGGVAGIVTIEDVLEEIVGEIFDEKDKVDPEIRRVGHNIAYVKGKADLDDVNKKLSLSLEVEGDVDTLSGFILKKLGKIPAKGDTIKEENFEIEILETRKNRISLVKITKS